MDGAFREMRSILNSTVLSEKQYGRILGISRHVSQKAPELYQAQWLPYMASFPHHWKNHIFSTSDSIEFRNVLPFALFKASFLHEKPEATLGHPKDWWEHLGGIEFSKNFPSPLIMSQMLPCPSLRVVECTHVPLTNERIQSLIHWIKHSPIRVLNLQLSVTEKNGINTLIHSGILEELETLNLNYCGVGNDEVCRLAALKWKRLQELHLNCVEITDEGMMALTRSRDLKQLEVLSLEYNDLGIKSAIALANSESLPRLRHLNVDWVNFDIEGLKALSESKNFHPELHNQFAKYMNQLKSEYERILDEI